ncbi:MAG TPA: MFS transporter [Salinisphaera sp.]|nr:MFS transporter [Salinisphaera sp.]HET7313856.1 MFS transporter [Salinisphaera sp.]
MCPNIVFTTAFPLLLPGIAHGLGTSEFFPQLGEALSNAAYSFGAVAAADLAQRFSQRRLFIIYEAIFIVGSILALFAPGPAAFVLGRILQGLGTGLLLVSALPPLVTNFPAAKLPVTAIWVNIGLFGAVTVGPFVGGLVAHFEAWRALFAGLAVLGIGGFALALATLELQPGDDPGQPIDWLAFPLAIAATALPFFGVTWLGVSSFMSPGFIAPVVLGLAALGALIVMQYRKRQAFIPVGPLFSTFPVCGILAAMVGGATSVTLLELTIAYLTRVAHYDPFMTGLLFLPEFLGLIVAAYLFRHMLATRGLPALALSGLAAIIAGAALLIPLTPARAPFLVPIAAALLGYGSGSAVAPGLFMAGMSVFSTKLGRTFALVELLRAEAAFLVGPVLLSLAVALAPPLGDSLRLSLWATLGIGVFGIAAIVILLALGGVWPRRPDLQEWLERGGRALHSPPLAAFLRSRR